MLRIPDATACKNFAYAPNGTYHNCYAGHANSARLIIENERAKGPQLLVVYFCVGKHFPILGVFGECWNDPKSYPCIQKWKGYGGRCGTDVWQRSDGLRCENETDK